MGTCARAEQGRAGTPAQPSASKAEGPSTPGLDAQPAGKPPQGSNGLPIALSSVRRADVSQFKGMTFVNIREYYQVGHLPPCDTRAAPHASGVLWRFETQTAGVQKDGEMRPGAKGISLSPDQFGILKEAAADISTALQAQDTGFRLALSSKYGGPASMCCTMSCMRRCLADQCGAGRGCMMLLLWAGGWCGSPSSRGQPLWT